MRKIVTELNTNEGGVDRFSRAYQEYGIHVLGDNSVKCLEWAPDAKQLYLKGDFSESFVP